MRLERRQPWQARCGVGHLLTVSLASGKVLLWLISSLRMNSIVVGLQCRRLNLQTLREFANTESVHSSALNSLNLLKGEPGMPARQSGSSRYWQGLGHRSVLPRYACLDRESLRIPHVRHML